MNICTEHQDAKVVNCASCGELLSNDDRLTHIRSIGGRILGRPYCSNCIRPSSHGTPGVRRCPYDRDGDAAHPYQEIAIRGMEDPIQ